MANPSKQDSAAGKVAAVARSIVTYQIALSVGCRRMRRTLSRLAPQETKVPTVFDQYLSKTLNLPIGSERLHWDRAVLRQKDIEIERINQQFRDQILEACWDLIDRFGDSSPVVGKPID